MVTCIKAFSEDISLPFCQQLADIMDKSPSFDIFVFADQVLFVVAGLSFKKTGKQVLIGFCIF